MAIGTRVLGVSIRSNKLDSQSYHMKMEYGLPFLYAKQLKPIIFFPKPSSQLFFFLIFPSPYAWLVSVFFDPINNQNIPIIIEQMHSHRRPPDASSKGSHPLRLPHQKSHFPLQLTTIGSEWERLGVWIYQLACGLEYMHRRGIIHRDVKPDNIGLDEQGNVKLLDFGSALLKWELQQEGFSLVGTPAYIAPKDSREKYDEKVDIYALGICIFELVHGGGRLKGFSQRVLETDRLLPNYDGRGVPLGFRGAAQGPIETHHCQDSPEYSCFQSEQARIRCRFILHRHDGQHDRVRYSMGVCGVCRVWGNADYFQLLSSCSPRPLMITPMDFSTLSIGLPG